MSEKKKKEKTHIKNKCKTKINKFELQEEQKLLNRDRTLSLSLCTHLCFSRVDFQASKSEIYTDLNYGMFLCLSFGRSRKSPYDPHGSKSDSLPLQAPRVLGLHPIVY